MTTVRSYTFFSSRQPKHTDDSEYLTGVYCFINAPFSLPELVFMGKVHARWYLACKQTKELKGLRKTEIHRCNTSIDFTAHEEASTSCVACFLVIRLHSSPVSVR